MKTMSQKGTRGELSMLFMGAVSRQLAGAPRIAGAPTMVSSALMVRRGSRVVNDETTLDVIVGHRRTGGGTSW